MDKENNIKIEDYLFLDKENDEFIKKFIELNKISQKIHSINDFTSLISNTTSLLINFFNCEKGCILLLDEIEQNINIKFAINLYNEPTKLENFNNIFLKPLLLNKDTNFFLNNINNKDYKNISSILLGLIKQKDNIIGYIALFNFKSSFFNDKDSFFIQEISNQFSIALENVLLNENLKKEIDIRNFLQRHLPSNIVSKVIQKKLNIPLSGNKEKGVVVFFNFRNIDEISEKITIENFFKLINYIVTTITKIIFSYNGIVERISSNSISCVFGITEKSDDDINLAMIASLEIKELLEHNLNIIKNDYKIDDFELGIGIDYGYILYGSIGFYQRNDLVISGKIIKYARKISKTSKKGIFISENVFELSKDKFKFSENIIKIEEKNVFELISKLSDEEVTKNENLMRINTRVSLKTLAYIVKGNTRSSGVIRDISSGGVSIGTVGNYQINDNIMLAFKLPNNVTFRNIKGIIKYIEKAKFESALNKINVIMGVEFVNLESNNLKEIIGFIEDFEKNKI